MKKLLLILLCLPFYSLARVKEKEDNKTISKELATDIIKELDSINNKKRKLIFCEKKKIPSAIK